MKTYLRVNSCECDFIHRGTSQTRSQCFCYTVQCSFVGSFCCFELHPCSPAWQISLLSPAPRIHLQLLTKASLRLWQGPFIKYPLKYLHFLSFHAYHQSYCGTFSQSMSSVFCKAPHPTYSAGFPDSAPTVVSSFLPTINCLLPSYHCRTLHIVSNNSLIS